VIAEKFYFYTTVTEEFL